VAEVEVAEVALPELELREAGQGALVPTEVLLLPIQAVVGVEAVKQPLPTTVAETVGLAL
jgi:hypothetical protein